jgi:hypothetical protein
VPERQGTAKCRKHDKRLRGIQRWSLGCAFISDEGYTDLELVWKESWDEWRYLSQFGEYQL